MPAASSGSAIPLVALGVDLSTSPASTGLCQLDLRGARPRATFAPTPALRTLDAIVAQAAALWAETDGRLRIGIDAPFGWPVAWTRLLAASADLALIPAGESVDDDARGSTQPLARSLRWRLTDEALWNWSAGRIRPMTPSTDRLAATAARCVDLLARLRDAAIPVSRSGVASAAFEIYPTAAMHAWGLLDPGGRTAARGRLLALVQPHIDHDLPRAPSEHDVDAFAAALTVAGEMKAVLPADADPTTVAAEGAMFVPTGELVLSGTSPRIS